MRASQGVSSLKQLFFLVGKPIHCLDYHVLVVFDGLAVKSESAGHAGRETALVATWAMIHVDVVEW